MHARPDAHLPVVAAAGWTARIHWGLEGLEVLEQSANALLQDIAVVPFLVLLPLVESNDVTTMGAMDLLSQLGPTALQTIGSLGLLLLGGRTVLRRVFQVSWLPRTGAQSPTGVACPEHRCQDEGRSAAGARCGCCCL